MSEAFSISHVYGLNLQFLTRQIPYANSVSNTAISFKLQFYGTYKLTALPGLRITWLVFLLYDSNCNFAVGQLVYKTWTLKPFLLCLICYESTISNWTIFTQRLQHSIHDLNWVCNIKSIWSYKIGLQSHILTEI